MARWYPGKSCMDDTPRNLKDMLSEAKDTSELMVDLGYAALFFSDERMADEVAELEERLNELVHEMREELELWILRASAETIDPSSLRGLLHLGGASEEIGDAAQQLVWLVEQGE